MILSQLNLIGQMKCCKGNAKLLTVRWLTVVNVRVETAWLTNVVKEPLGPVKLNLASLVGRCSFSDIMPSVPLYQYHTILQEAWKPAKWKMAPDFCMLWKKNSGIIICCLNLAAQTGYLACCPWKALSVKFKLISTAPDYKNKDKTITLNHFIL